MEKDINDVFDEILFTEEILISESYQKGYTEGKHQDNPEAYHSGYHRGAEIGAEVGFYLGIIENIYKEHYSSVSEKIKLAVLTLKEQIHNFPKENSESDILGQLDNIRAGYKKICALLKLNSSYPEADQLSF